MQLPAEALEAGGGGGWEVQGGREARLGGRQAAKVGRRDRGGQESEEGGEPQSRPK